MRNSSWSEEDKAFHIRTMDAAIRIALLSLLVLWCFNIMRPFIMPVLWGAIMAVAIYPLFVKAYTALGGRRKLTATLITLLALTLLITPTVMLAGSLVENTKSLAEQVQTGSLAVPPPSDTVKDWPLIGEKLYGSWKLASVNLEAALQKFSPQVEAASKWMLSAAAGIGGGILMFIVAIVVAGAFLVVGRSGSEAMETIAGRLMGTKGGKEFVQLAGATIRSVAQGVLGVALIQSTLAAIGLLVMGVPYAGVWAILVLFCAIVQLPPLLILGPIIVYEFSVAETLPAVVFMVWSLFVSVSDSFLKPLFLGRGMDTPMLVILLGAIGGMMLSGIIGLFVGAVVLAVGYSLLIAWLAQEAPDSETDASAES
jgi:predicted PurR-regulated permease PerM